MLALHICFLFTISRTKLLESIGALRGGGLHFSLRSCTLAVILLLFAETETAIARCQSYEQKISGISVEKKVGAVWGLTKNPLFPGEVMSETKGGEGALNVYICQSDWFGMLSGSTASPSLPSSLMFSSGDHGSKVMKI